MAVARADRILSEIEPHRDTDVSDFVRLAREFVRKGNPKVAMKNYRQACDASEDASLFHEFGAYLVGLGKHEQAFKLVKRATRKFPEDKKLKSLRRTLRKS